MVTVVGLLNALLSILFPLWPWEPFFIMPFVLEYFKANGNIKNVVLFLTVFGATFCLAHGSGLLQAIDTFFYGGKGICVPALPGAPKDIDTGAMCTNMAIHIFMMLAMGIFFATLALNPRRRVPTANLEAVYYSRAALFFVIGGVSQDIPYWAVCLQYPERFYEFMTMDGFYSARGITPGFTEFFAPIVWILYGIYAYTKLMSMIDTSATSAVMM
mmetsp:Transcript_43162/g.113369  ORF Transcript_43162/g.113369 Transcript_43162/m.113369 type:complete len:215 (-) Transcript_43162:282-926(-)